MNKTLSLLVIGLGTGYLMGLSISPVAAIAIGGLIGGSGIVFAVMKTGDKRPQFEADLLAIVIVGLVIGTILGIYSRTSNFLGVSTISAEAEQWTELGLDRSFVVQRLFANSYPSYHNNFLIPTGELDNEVEKWTKLGISQTLVAEQLFNYLYSQKLSESDDQGAEKLSNAKTDHEDGVLFSAPVSSDECNKFLGMIDKPLALIDELKNSEKYYLKVLAETLLTDTAKLTDIIQLELCVVRN